MRYTKQQMQQLAIAVLDPKFQNSLHFHIKMSSLIYYTGLTIEECMRRIAELAEKGETEDSINR